MPELQSQEIRLKSRPVGLPTLENFELVTTSVPEPAAGQMVVQNLYMSVDPYMRGRMNDRKSYTPPFQLGEALNGGAVGKVIASNGGKFQSGDYVSSGLGWREYFVSDGRGLTPIDPAVAPIQAYLGAAGMPGQTAYFGLLDIGQPQAGETVFVSAAAGAVGSMVCQIAKIKGCRVVGSAGSDAKVAWLQEELGVDAAFNYKKTDHLTRTLASHCPDGIDVYFENVGGAHLEAALTVMNQNGRIPVCGMISSYNASKPEPGPSNLFNIIGKRLLLKGFIVTDYASRSAEFYADLRQWIAAGQIKWHETIVEGIENAPNAFIGLFKGENMGKMLVKLGQ
ncbi:MAG: NADP-dependent oxidoreductase [Caldilineaceae bacterium]|nr:NADP-dependent oxidoreductase [Caldilineaceae bacterium]